MTVELLGVELHAFHGALAWERREGQRFLVDLWLDPADDRAGVTDALEDAIDYREVIRLVQEISGGRAFTLIEGFATAIADGLLARFPLAGVRVRVRKPDVQLALPVEHAAAIVERSR